MYSFWPASSSAATSAAAATDSSLEVSISTTLQRSPQPGSSAASSATAAWPRGTERQQAALPTAGRGLVLGSAGALHAVDDRAFGHGVHQRAAQARALAVGDEAPRRVSIVARQVHLQLCMAVAAILKPEHFPLVLPHGDDRARGFDVSPPKQRFLVSETARST